MKISRHLYRVLLPGSLAPRLGSLVRVEFEKNLTGYADLMSWPELGQLQLDDEWRQLRQGTPTPLGQQVLHLARQDAIARRENQSLTAGLKPTPPSHYLLGKSQDLALFRPVLGTVAPIAFKLKVVGPHLPSELKNFPHPVRLDWNESGKLEELIEELSEVQIRAKIDFIEDPFPATQPQAWRRFKQTYPDVAVFGDFVLEKNPELLAFCDGVVLKPASRSVETLHREAVRQGKRICVTHSMGHPLGQAVAAWFAASVQCESTGLLPRPLLADGNFKWSKLLDGPGFGWPTDQFEALLWSSA